MPCSRGGGYIAAVLHLFEVKNNTQQPGRHLQVCIDFARRGHFINKSIGSLIAAHQSSFVDSSSRFQTPPPFSPQEKLFSWGKKGVRASLFGGEASCGIHFQETFHQVQELPLPHAKVDFSES